MVSEKSNRRRESMSREYAVLSGADLLYKTAGFDGETVTETVPLSDGKTLLVAGEDPGQAELLQKLREAEETISAKELFLSNMSHDMRTPMNAIMGMTTLAERHIDEKARVADALSKIEVASGHLLSLINNVLDMSRINSGRMKIDEQRFSIGDLLHDLTILSKPLVEQKKHDFILDTEGVTTENYLGDALRLRQIYINIISNAAKYTEDGGVIRVTVSDEESDSGEKDRRILVFRCTDNGIGMTKEFLGRIYDPFERVNNTTVSKIEGTGLGMSIVKRIIDVMGGEIRIDSAPGQGTDVLIRIPLRAEEQGGVPEGLSGKRFLILEGDEKASERYRRILGKDGIPFTRVSSVADALDALADADVNGTKYDLAVIGQSLTDGGDKLDVAAYLAKAAPSLPMVLVSEDNWEDIEYRAERCGIRAFVPIPFFRLTLEKVLSDVSSDSRDADGGSEFPDLTGRRILLAEDNLINREIALEILGMTGAQIDAAENGEEAVRLYESADPGAYTVILMDVQMPVMNGYEATGRIRSSKRADAATVPIYAMTANTFAEDVARAKDAGMDGHIAKPIDINALMQVLRKARG
jgi:signal transduction histidine kinase/DNA-binding response OmpR family regulator